MSHSTLLVIVENAQTEQEALAIAEDRLAPYWEELEVEPYANGNIDTSDLGWAFYGAEDKRPSEEVLQYELSNPTEEGVKKLTDYFGGEVKIEDGKYVSYSTYNPNSKWDWYEVGGRWNGMIPSISKVAGVNITQKKDVDFISGQRKAITDANEEYDRYEKLAGHLMPGPTFQECIDKYSYMEDEQDQLAAARDEYHRDPWVKAVQSSFGIFFGSPQEYFFVNNGGRKAFVDEASRSYLSTHAVLTDNSQWLEKGSMGWFGMVSNEMDADNWTSIFWDSISEASSEAWFIVFDLHI
jgi:hypothetical protein